MARHGALLLAKMWDSAITFPRESKRTDTLHIRREEIARKAENLKFFLFIAGEELQQ
jgi:hypothetical protein